MRGCYGKSGTEWERKKVREKKGKRKKEADEIRFNRQQ